MIVDVDPAKVVALHQALFSMVEFWHRLPGDVKRPYVGMRECVAQYSDQFGPWIESAPWDGEHHIKPALEAIGVDPDEDLLELGILEARLEVELRRADAWQRDARRLRALLEANGIDPTPSARLRGEPT